MELEQERINLRNQMNKAEMDMNKLISNFQADNRAMERRLKRMEEEHERDRRYLERQLVQATARAEEAATRARNAQAAARARNVQATARARNEQAAARARNEQNAAASRLTQLRYPICYTTVYPCGPWGPYYTTVTYAQ